MENKLHTPEGLKDIYGIECKKKLALQEIILNKLHLFGYQDIQTPTFEYLDVFRKEVGSNPVRELYKFFDKEGDILALRPDITPSVARAVATSFEKEQMPIRLCYVGNTFVNHSSYQGRLKENTQLGAELVGDNSVEADAELIAMVVECLRDVGLKDFQISIGHVDFIQSLLEGTNLDSVIKGEIRELLSNRNYSSIEEILKEKGANPEVVKGFQALPDLIGGYEVLGKAADVANSKEAKLAIVRLLKIYSLLVLYGVEKYITFDMSTTGKYGYYSGIVFRGYTHGTGDAVVRGGRYDELLGIFGKKTPSIGFAIIVDTLLSALNGQNIHIKTRDTNIIVYSESNQDEAISMAMDFRVGGKCIELLKKEPNELIETYIEYGKRMKVNSILVLLDGGELKIINPETGEEQVVSVAQ